VIDDEPPAAGADDRIAAGPATSEHGISSVSPLSSPRTALGATGHDEFGEMIESRRADRTQRPVRGVAGGVLDERMVDHSQASGPEPDGDVGPSLSTVKPQMSSRRSDLSDRSQVGQPRRVLPRKDEAAAGTSDPATGRGGRRRSSVDEGLRDGQHAPAPTIHVTIGRIEVRAVAPQSSAGHAATGPVVLPLEQYLRERVAARQR
jgi:hypothetical protein